MDDDDEDEPSVQEVLNSGVGEVLEECDQLCNIIGQSIVTAKNNSEPKRRRP